MTRTNTPTQTQTLTHGKAEGLSFTPEQELRRAVLCALLGEDQHYESGDTLKARIAALACEVDQETAEAIAIETREKHNIRHASLWILAARLKGRQPVSAETIQRVISRADEPGELIAMYWVDGKRPLPAQAKKGVAAALPKFDAYQLGKYDRKNDAVRLRDVMRLTHPTPVDAAQSAVWAKLIAGELESPDTWEAQLSGGADKRETFERLLRENKLGYMALLRNLRGMEEAGVDRQLVKDAILARKGADKVLPFRFIAAAKEAPRFEAELDEAMLASAASRPVLKGKTVIVVDTSGSMRHALGGKSRMTRWEAAAAIAMAAKAQCEDAEVYVTADSTGLVPPRNGMALRDAIDNTAPSHGWGGIYTKKMCEQIRREVPNCERMIVVTDEQDCGGYANRPSDATPAGSKHNYMINVGSYKNGIAFPNKWVSMTGFSDRVLDFIHEYEAAS